MNPLVWTREGKRGHSTSVECLSFSMAPLPQPPVPAGDPARRIQQIAEHAVAALQRVQTAHQRHHAGAYASSLSSST